ncbi:uncharacterized protein LOC133186394 [Saccostrea echinata]|uniref:uncharacterized protein LOC133186394 n=1 Tax=Saccostrea echinata TaxID=191078 RepID=UPI002A804424|nr:uncharacterized protein LOC133186394 [Saccostrea echinata]
MLKVKPFCCLLIPFYEMQVLCVINCPSIQQTARPVNECPKSEVAWKEAAARMNCEHIMQNCSQQRQYEYHCALNIFLNESWELCSIMKYMLGYCMEYNEEGKRIQNNYHRKCLDLNPPCPTRYKSTETYKYQSCYKKVKENDLLSSKLSETTLRLDNTTSSTNDKNHNGEMQSDWIIVVMSSIVIFGTLAVVGYIIWRKKLNRLKKMRILYH